MTSSPQYNINALSGYTPMNWDSIMYNPYFLMAANSPNVNFKGSTEASANVTNSGNSQSVNQVAAQAEEPSEGVSLTQGVMALALIGAGAYGIIKGHKSGYFEKMWKKVTGKSNDKTVNTVLQQMAAVKNGNGEIKIKVPNKTTTFSGKNIQSKVDEYGINSSISAAKQEFNPQVSAIKSFHITTPEDSYTVFLKDGEITKVVSTLMKKDEDVLARLVNAESKSSDSQILERFKKIAEELAKDTKEADKAVLKDVTNIRYSNQYGDDTLNMIMKKYGETPKLQSFKTLEQFDKTSEAVKSYNPSSAEEVFAGSIVNETGGLLSKKGVLADGLGVLRCDEEIVRGTRCFFEGDKLVKIQEVVDGKVVDYSAGSFRYIDFVKEHQKEIDAFKKDVFTDRIASKIPKGADIGLV